jgi:diphosphomevalonate decarboxylase
MSNLIDPTKNKIKVGWESPSNIALIKYWGKHGRQLPNNASLSFTLNTAASRTFIALDGTNESGQMEIDFTFEGKQNDTFKNRIEKFLLSIADEYFPFLREYKLKIDSSNSFPHSSGIASSASGMSALSLCLCDIDYQLNAQDILNEDFFRKASLIARLGSGSASRSVFSKMALWGKHPDFKLSSDDFAVSLEDEIHPIFHTFRNDILIISANEKSVSSTAGHRLMEGNPYAESRYKQANERLSILHTALKSGDLDTFGRITEDEALTLHALMMCSDPSYILMEEGSLSVIKKIKEFRKKTNIPVYFTLDAGPNVHVLYPSEWVAPVTEFIINELKHYCHEGKIIKDHVGNGPQKIA